MGSEVNLVYYKYYSGLGINNRNLEVISNFEIYFSNRSQFNDPFDTFPSAEVPTKAQVREKLWRTANNAYPRNPLITAELQAAVKENLQANESELIRRQQEFWSNSDNIKRFCEQYCILCLARSPLNRLMWAHYGANHTGFALEFDFIDVLSRDPRLTDRTKPDFIPQPVLYTKSRPGFQNSSTEHILLNKDDIWEYEDEHRVIFEGQNGLYSYKREYLKSVYLGAEMTASDKQEISNMVYEVNRKYNLGIAIKTIKLSADSYDLICDI